MYYKIFSLNGDWEMDYTQQVYTGKENPWQKGTLISNAVPGYWEDMVSSFAGTPFEKDLKINPEYGGQTYPMTGEAPDMALPNIVGNFFYRRTFVLEKGAEPVEIYFEGVQNSASVWLNDVYLGRHEGYSTPFALAIPENVLKNGENTIVISVSNTELSGYDGQIVSGLTNRAANQYTGGITGKVELRMFTSPLRDAYVQISEGCAQACVMVETAENTTFAWSVLDAEQVLLSGTDHGDFSFDAAKLEKWTPENPKLYTLRISCGESVLERKFGVRRLTAEGTQLRLNGIPVYLRGICEHCYYPETVHTNHDLEHYRFVIRKVKELGFNFIRFHTHIPEEEYMQAADELGMLVEVESPNNTTVAEWQQIVKFCRRHTCVVLYSCGNELAMDEPFIDHQHKCADAVHEGTDSLFSPMSAMRGLEYVWTDADWQGENGMPALENEPFTHHPKRFETVGSFADVYNSYTLGLTSYESLTADAEKLDSWSVVYQKPRLSHEIGIQGTYTDLSLVPRYEGTRVGQTDMFPSIARHLAEKGLLDRAPLYFENSSHWQRLLRKHNFEAVRMCRELAGYDFLGPIDTHWHTFGYDVGMMNEFYELKPGETVRNVRMYNSPTVLLTDLGTDFVFTAGEELKFGLFVSHFGAAALTDAALNVELFLEEKQIYHRAETVKNIENGTVSKLLNVSAVLPVQEKPGAMKLRVTLAAQDIFAENEWELYLFPKAEESSGGDLVIAQDMSAQELMDAMAAGKNVLLFGAQVFTSLPATFQMALAGRTAGNSATVIKEHPAIKDLPHEGFCGWQFRRLLEGANAVCFPDGVPFDPIIEVVSTHKNVIKQAVLFEFGILQGKLLVCTFHMEDADPAARWLKAELMKYACSDAFQPKYELNEEQLELLTEARKVEVTQNTNRAMNLNDKTAIRKKKKVAQEEQ